jgi:hypothetical protein
MALYMAFCFVLYLTRHYKAKKLKAELPPYDKAFLQELEESLASLFLEAKGRGVDANLFETLIRKAMKSRGKS